MTDPFNPLRGLIVVRSEITGPSGSAVLRLALDTGATRTMINVGPLAAMGYDPSLISERVQVTTGSGVEYVPLLGVQLIRALGQERRNFSVLAHTLPSSASIDGVLGLDFLRGQILNVDFLNGRLTLG